MKIDVDKAVCEIPEDEETVASRIYRMTVNFLIRGKILALPKYQKDIYSDEEVFGKNFPESIKVLFSTNEDYLRTFDNGIGAVHSNLYRLLSQVGRLIYSLNLG